MMRGGFERGFRPGGQPGGMERGPRFGPGGFQGNGNGNGPMRGMMHGMAPMGMRQGFDPASRVDRMKQALGLTDQQADRIKSIFEQQQARMESAMKNADSSRGQNWRADRDQFRTQIAAVLTPEQRTKWQQFTPDRMEHP